MIGRLKGELLLKQPPQLLVDVSGVGYELEAPMSTIYDLPEVGHEVVLLTHLTIRDDAHILFAFLTEAERSLFRTLIKVNGVGPKMGLGILSAMNPAEFRTRVLQGDNTALTKIPGVGKKTAERLIIEMRDRLEKTEAGMDSFIIGTSETNRANSLTEATQALVALGYKPHEASRMTGRINSDGLSSDEIIRQSLRAVL